MPAPDRARRYRERLSRGRAVFRLDLPEAEVVIALIDAGLLDPNKADDRQEIEQALARLVEEIVAPPPPAA